MKTLVAPTAQALQLVGMVHLRTMMAIIRMMHDEVLAGATHGTLPAGVVFDLLGGHVPITGLEEITVRHAANPPVDLLLVGSPGIGNHAIEAIPFTGAAGSQIFTAKLRGSHNTNHLRV